MLNDEYLVGVISSADDGEAPRMTAIDAPLGWPALFAAVIAKQSDWPAGLEGDPSNLLRRSTDLRIAEITGKSPLAVTTERIAYAAFRANRILAELERRHGATIDRSGLHGAVCETYPDAAIREFGLWPAGLAARASYKSADPAVRSSIIEGLRARAPWLEISAEDLGNLRASDDCLDALICALVAKAVVDKRTVEPEDPRLAQVEGWIHVPRDAGALELLDPRGTAGA